MYGPGFFKKAKEKINYEKASDGIINDSQVCAFTGHRPQKLSIEYESSRECLVLKSKLHETIKRVMLAGCFSFMTGMAVGVDTWAAEEVLLLKTRYPDLKLYAAVPYKNQYARLYNWQKERYFRILSRCEKVFLISEDYHKSCFYQRNAFMVNHATVIISVYDGGVGGTANTIALAEKKGIDIYNINPNVEPVSFY